MANPKKAIFYPTIEGNISTYYNKIKGHLTGAMGTKYGTSSETQGKLTTHNTDIPQVIQTAYDSRQTAQGDTETKDKELHDAEIEIKRELQRITGLDNWEEEDGETLGIRVYHEPPDPATMKPEITGKSILPEKIEIDWVKKGMQGVIVHGSYDGSSFSQIGTDGRSPYEDFRKNQQEGQPETRHYKLRYMKDDKPIGLESDVVKVVAEIY